MRAPSKNTSLNSAVPVSCRMGRTVMPGWSMGTSRYDSPAERRDPGSVLASRKHQSATVASDVQTFWPVMTQSSPSSTADV